MSAHSISARHGSGSLEPQPNDRAVLLVTTVDIGEGKKGRIEIREGDDPTGAARQFCQVHGLPDTIVEPLTLHIHEHLFRGFMASGDDNAEVGITPLFTS